MKKTILITGAGSGIGKDAAFALSRRGHRVIAAAETSSQAEALHAQALHEAITLETITLEITIAEDREKISAYDLDVLINNAGIGETGSLAEVPMDRVRRNFEVNVFSTIEVAQIALKGMMHKHKGTIIFVSSIAGRIPSLFLNPYSMTKFALSGGVAAMRQEIHRVEKDVHISLIEPGAYATGFNQRMLAKKYEWMDEKSYFYPIIPALKAEDTHRFGAIEQKSTASIVAKIVIACEARKPRLRYVAPWYQGFAVAMLRVFGI
jgi:short-subunit dehydrogenase